jgi:hypothetical protein
MRRIWERVWDIIELFWKVIWFLQSVSVPNSGGRLIYLKPDYSIYVVVIDTVIPGLLGLDLEFLAQG